MRSSCFYLRPELCHRAKVMKEVPAQDYFAACVVKYKPVNTIVKRTSTTVTTDSSRTSIPYCDSAYLLFQKVRTKGLEGNWIGKRTRRRAERSRTLIVDILRVPLSSVPAIL